MPEQIHERKNGMRDDFIPSFSTLCKLELPMSLVSVCAQCTRTGVRSHTCGLLNVGQSPHGELLSMVRLAGIAGCWPDALIPESAQVCHTQLLTPTVSPQFSANSLMELLGKGL